MLKNVQETLIDSCRKTRTSTSENLVNRSTGSIKPFRASDKNIWKGRIGHYRYLLSFFTRVLIMINFIFLGKVTISQKYTLKFSVVILPFNYWPPKEIIFLNVFVIIISLPCIEL